MGGKKRRFRMPLTHPPVAWKTAEKKDGFVIMALNRPVTFD